MERIPFNVAFTEAVKIVKDSASVTTLERNSMTERLFDFASKEQVKITPNEAAVKLKQTLSTLLAYNQKYPDYGGFLPWVDIRPNGTIAPASTKKISGA